MRHLATASVAIAALACTSGPATSSSSPGTSGAYVLVAWNDLGMHCLNPTYDTAVILPPYNTLWAQVIQRGSPPRIVSQGVTVEYRIVDNTRSYGKASYGQFWDHALALFGVAPARDHGLNLSDPATSNGLAGRMVVSTRADHFEAVGIPVVPVDDGGAWNPYQVAELTAKDPSGAVLATVRTTVPTSDEIDCSKCHGSNAFANILATHDRLSGTSLVTSQPVLCASCHASPALGMMARRNGLSWLSEAVHGFHGGLAAGSRPACYDCHPGARTQCSRSLAHTSGDGNCTSCHGALTDVGAAARVPWVNEPSCTQCHAATIAETTTGSTLYRNAVGHGGLSCPACHGSPHAMRPSRVDSDDAQVGTYLDQLVPNVSRSRTKTLGSCGACHSSSRGDSNLGEFAEEHGGTNPKRRNACHVCHTSLSTDTTRWPHAFGWKAR